MGQIRALVAQDPVGIEVVQLRQRIIAFDLVRFSGDHVEGQRVAFSVRAEVDFCGKAAARATERFLISIPPFYADCMLVRPDDCGIDGMLLVCWRPKIRQGFECRVPEFQLPYRSGMRHGAGAQNPENAIHHSPLVGDWRTAVAAIGKQRIENAPFRVR